MIAVIFELQANDGYEEAYLSLAQELKSSLTHINGFISIERFQSLADSNKLLSLSFWENEEAIHAWRNSEFHRQAQSQGRKEILKHYRLRVAAVVRDYGLTDRENVPVDSVAFHKS